MTEPARQTRVGFAAGAGGGDDRLRLGELTGLGVVDHAAARQDLGQTPVHDLDLAEAADHHVGGLQVAVDHPPGVGVGDGLADLLEDAQDAGQGVLRRRTGGEHLGEGLALDQLHGEVGATVGEGAQLVDRDDAGVLELAADLRLLDEAADEGGVVPVLLQEDLDGEVASEVLVSALEHGAHAAAGDLAEQPEPGVALLGRRHLGGGGLVDGRLGGGVGVAEQDAGHRPDGGGERLQDARRPGEVDGGADLAGVGEAQGVGVEAGPEQAAGAEALGGAGRQLGAAAWAGAGVGHRRDSWSGVGGSGRYPLLPAPRPDHTDAGRI